MDTPLISAVIPAYNAERFAGEAIRSILRQHYPRMEIIVVNDGSTDGTREILASFGDQIAVIHQENRGPSAARNVGIRAARGEVIGFLDADDLWTDDHTELLLPHILEGADIVHGRTRYVQGLGTPAEKISEPVLRLGIMGGFLCRRSLFDQVGLFDESLFAGEDTDWYLSVMHAGAVEKHIDAAVFLYRRHEANATNDIALQKRGMLNAVRKQLHRAAKNSRI